MRSLMWWSFWQSSVWWYNQRLNQRLLGLWKPRRREERRLSHLEKAKAFQKHCIERESTPSSLPPLFQWYCTSHIPLQNENHWSNPTDPNDDYHFFRGRKTFSFPSFHQLREFKPFSFLSLFSLPFFPGNGSRTLRKKYHMTSILFFRFLNELSSWRIWLKDVWLLIHLKKALNYLVVFLYMSTLGRSDILYKPCRVYFIRIFTNIDYWWKIPIQWCFHTSWSHCN